MSGDIKGRFHNLSFSDVLITKSVPAEDRKPGIDFHKQSALYLVQFL